jgi:hypothetical protein
MLLRSLGAYTVMDLIELSRELDPGSDIAVISEMIGSPSGEGKGPYGNVPYSNGIVIPTPKRILIRLKGGTSDEFRRVYRRRIRNLAMLLLIQRSLYQRALGIDWRELSSAVKGGGFVCQLKNIFYPPKVSEAFSVLHYLTAQEPAFGAHRSVVEMYEALKPIIDQQETIDKSTGSLVQSLKQMKDDITASGKLASEGVSAISMAVSALLPH